MHYQELLAWIDTDHLIVTVNERLARFLWQAKLSSGQVLLRHTLQSWQSLATSWWQSIEWHIPNAPSLMSATQSLSLWQDIIHHSDDADLLFSAETAKMAREAWLMHKKWSIPVEALSAYGSHAYFVEWCSAFEARSAELTLHDGADLLSLLIEHAAYLEKHLPRHMTLIGFDDIPPQLEALLNKLMSFGMQYEFFKPEGTCAAVSLYAASTREQEFYHACARAKQVLEDHPQATFGIVLPDLESQRESILKVAQSVFLGPPSPLYEQVEDWPFTISGGQVLSHLPIIAHALLCLKLPMSSQYSDWSFFLHSPFIHTSVGEKQERLKLDNVLRQRCNQKISFHTMKSLILEYEGVETLKTILQSLYALDLRKPKTYSAWRTVVYELLDVVGWPVATAPHPRATPHPTVTPHPTAATRPAACPRDPSSLPLSSASHQAVVHFYRAIDGLCALDGMGSTVSYAEYFRQLSTTITQVSFSPESSSTARCHILGGLEAAGIVFDTLWFCGLSDDIWPKEPQPNPFIPFVLARQYNIPRSTSQRELHFSKSMMQRFLLCARQVIFSYPETQRGLPAQKSPLLAQYGEAEKLGRFEPLEVIAFREAPALEFLTDDQALAVNAEEKLSLQGGASIVKAQSLCAFQAFAKYRLHAHALPEPSETMDMAIRGVVVHAVLESLWKTLQTQAALLAHTEEALALLITDKVHNTLQRFARKDGVMFSSAWCNIESKRLISLMHHWLALERERASFSVLEMEKTLLLSLQGLPIKLRLDRVDRLASGHTIVIDYKTGEVSSQDWFGDVLMAPQLPLYATAYETDGIAFAKIHHKECRMVGVAAQTLGPLTAISDLEETDASSWDEQKEVWRNKLNLLVTDFLKGKASVAPCSIEKACRYCDLHTLCRVGERSAL